MRRLLLAFLLAGCGARVELATTDAAPDEKTKTTKTPSTDSGGGPIAYEDAASIDIDATPPPPDDPPPPAGGSTVFVDLEVCGSAADVDKIIFDMAESMAPLPDPSPVAVNPGGTTCSNAFDNSPSSGGGYAWGAKCGPIDRSKPIVVTVGAGVTTATGKALPAGTYTFQPTGKPGHLCGDEFRL